MHFSPPLQPDATSSSLSSVDHIDISTSANSSNASFLAHDDGLETYSDATQLCMTSEMSTVKRTFHERYHFEDGTAQVEVSTFRRLHVWSSSNQLLWQIEGVLYNIHRHFLEKDSSFFELNGKESHPIALTGIAAADFDAFLSIFYPKYVFEVENDVSLQTFLSIH